MKNIKSKDNKQLISNFLSLSVLQGTNYILPFITFPYLVKVLGVEYFGLIAFATALMVFFDTIADYGFNLIGTKEISINRNDKIKVVEIFSSIMTIKVILLVISFLLLLLITMSFEKFSNNAEIYFLTFGSVIGQVFLPTWFFRGMERMKYITYLNIIAKLIFTIAIFIFVHDQSDFYLVPILNSLGFITVGIIAQYIIRKDFNVKFKFQSVASTLFYLKEANHIFISNIAININTAIPTILLGFFTNDTTIGYFAAAEKIIQALKGLLTPVSQTIFPYISKKVNESKANGLLFIKKVLIVIIIFTSIVSISTFVFANNIIELLLSSEFTDSLIILQIMSVIPLLAGINNILGIQTLVNFNRKKAYTTILITASIFSVILGLILIPLYQHIGAAIVILLVEVSITCSMFLYLQLNTLKLVGKNNFDN